MLTAKDLAARLNGREIGDEIQEGEGREADAAGLVVVYGASDDLVEFDGAIHDEVGAYEGAVILLDAEGLLPGERDDSWTDDEMERYFLRKRSTHRAIKALWCAEPGISWTFETDIPHETFEIREEEEIFCRGIVFALSSLQTGD